MSNCWKVLDLLPAFKIRWRKGVSLAFTCRWWHFGMNIKHTYKKIPYLFILNKMPPSFPQTNSFIQLCRCNQILRNRPQFFRHKVPILNINACSQSAMFTQGTTGFSRAPHRLRFCLHGLITRLRPMARLKKKN